MESLINEGQRLSRDEVTRRFMDDENFSEYVISEYLAEQSDMDCFDLVSEIASICGWEDESRGWYALLSAALGAETMICRRLLRAIGADVTLAETMAHMLRDEHAYETNASPGIGWPELLRRIKVNDTL